MPKERFHSEQEIFTAINRAKQAAINAMAQAESVDAEIVRLRPYAGQAENIALLLEHARKLRTKARRIHEIKLVRLKATLAVFRTAQFEFAAHDPSVPYP